MEYLVTEIRTYRVEAEDKDEAKEKIEDEDFIECLIEIEDIQENE